MKTQTAEKEQFITDAVGHRVGVILDLATYERLREAAEDNADVRTYRSVKSKVAGEISKGEYSTLGDYRAKRPRKAK